MPAAKKAKPWPKSIGACADLLHELRTKRLEQQRIVDELDRQEKDLKEYIIQTLPKSDTGASGKLYRVSVVTKEVPRVSDWDAFYKHVKKTGNFELMQRRLSEAAVADRWDSKKEVPGVERFHVVSVSLNKI